MMDDFLWAMENQRITAVVAIDLSVAFDKVDHDILISVLSRKVAIQDTALRWVDSYLQPRNIKVNVGTDYSSVRPIKFSVPQGSAASPDSIQPTQVQ